MHLRLVARLGMNGSVPLLEGAEDGSAKVQEWYGVK